MSGEPRRDVDERLADWVDGRMSARELERFTAELRVNPRLRQDLADYERTVGALRAALRAPSAPSPMVDRVLAAIARERAAPAVPRAAWSPRHGWWSLAAAAALLAGAWWIDSWSAPDVATTAVATDDERRQAPAGEKPGEAGGGEDDRLGWRDAPHDAGQPAAAKKAAPDPSVAAVVEELAESTKPGAAASPEPAGTAAPKPAAPASADAAKLRLEAEVNERKAEGTASGAPSRAKQAGGGEAPPPVAKAPAGRPVAPGAPAAATEAKDALVAEAAKEVADAKGLEKERSAAPTLGSGLPPTPPGVVPLPLFEIEGVVAAPPRSAAPTRGNTGPPPAGGTRQAGVPDADNAGGEAPAAAATPLDAPALLAGFDRFLAQTIAPPAPAAAAKWLTRNGVVEATPWLAEAPAGGTRDKIGARDDETPVADKVERPAGAGAVMERTWLVEGAKDDVELLLRRAAAFAGARNWKTRAGEMPAAAAPPATVAGRLADLPAASSSAVGGGGAAVERVRVVLRLRLLPR